MHYWQQYLNQLLPNFNKKADDLNRIDQKMLGNFANFWYKILSQTAWEAFLKGRNWLKSLHFAAKTVKGTKITMLYASGKINQIIIKTT